MRKAQKVSMPPTLIKSRILYLPGANTKRDAGSKGAIIEMEADTITAMANGRGLIPNSIADCNAMGSTTKTDAAFDMGCVSKTV
ncbi:MAG: hypothetical protein ABIO44_06575, partial [Saprospiraceae bacterium]